MIKKHRSIVLILTGLCMALSACGSKENTPSVTDPQENNKSSNKSEQSAEFNPVKCDPWVNIPEVLSYVSANPTNPITVDCDYADRYQAVINSDYEGRNVSGLRIFDNNKAVTEKGDYGYLITKDAEITVLDTIFFSDNFVTILAMKEENIVGASFIHVYQTPTEVRGELVETYRFENADGSYQKITKDNLEKLRAEVFGEERHYMTSEEMKTALEALPEGYSYDGRWIIAGEKSYADCTAELIATEGSLDKGMLIESDTALSFELEDITEIKVKSGSSDIYISTDKKAPTDTLNYSTNWSEQYYLTDNGENIAPGTSVDMELRFYSGDKIIAYMLMNVEKNDNGYALHIALPTNYPKRDGEYPKVAEAFFDGMGEDYFENRNE